jgi:hypothetical protein
MSYFSFKASKVVVILASCADSITRDSTAVITNPSTCLTVDTTPLLANNTCNAHTH